MKILYGVVGEGMGHAIRSRVVLTHLLEEGHEVTVMASQRAVDYLGAGFDRVRRIHGMHIITEANRMRRGRTLRSNVRDGIAAIPKQIAAYFDLIESFEPECVISDFESWTYLYAKAHGIPILSVDNNQMINRCEHPPELIEVDRAGFEIARAFVKGKLPFCDHYLITTFFYPPVKKERTTLYPPILRTEILEASPSSGGHVLVYQTAEGHEELASVLSRTECEYRVYGMRRHLNEDVVEGNLTYRPFSERKFIEDLASAKAVISGGGFTVLSESVYLRKPILSTPVEGQFEQTLNALYVEREAFGRYAPEVTDRVIGEFLYALPRYQHRLSRYEQNGNELLFAGLDEQLDRVAAGL